MSKQGFSGKGTLEAVVRYGCSLDCEARLGVSYGHQAGEIGVYGNGYKPDGVPNAPGSWKLLVTKISYSVDTPLFPNAMNSGQRGNEATLNFAMECHK